MNTSFNKTGKRAGAGRFGMLGETFTKQNIVPVFKGGSFSYELKNFTIIEKKGYFSQMRTLFGGRLNLPRYRRIELIGEQYWLSKLRKRPRLHQYQSF